MTTTLSADDVRRLVMEPWCNECNAPIETLPDATHEHDNTRQALWARCPGCQPEGLEWHSVSWCFRHQTATGPSDEPAVFGSDHCRDNHVIDLILMAIARDGKKACNASAHRSKAYCGLIDAVMSADLTDAVTARHRLADLEDKT